MRRVAIVAAIPLILACGGGGDGGTGPAVVTITVTGARIERGSVVTLGAFLNGTRVVTPDLVWSAEPASAVEFLTDGTTKLKTAGTVRITAMTSAGSATRDVVVAAPPSILFDQAMSGNRDIYSIAIDGLDLVRLTTNVADERDPAVAGNTIVFTSYRNGNGELYSMPIGGGTETRLTTTTPDEEREVAFIPNASGANVGVMAFTSNGGSVAKLWRSTTLTAAPARAAPTFGYSGSIEGSPTFSPTGDIAFMSTADGPADLYLLAAATGVVTRLAGVGATPNFEPAWSYDGRYIAFGSARGGPAKIYRYGVTAHDTVALTTGAGDDGESAWLPDGRLVFTSWRSGNAELFVLDLDSPELRAIPTTGTEPRRATALRPVLPSRPAR